MASFKKVKDAHRWLANHEAFEPGRTKSKVDPSERLFNLEYEVLEKGFLVSDSHTKGGMMDRYFYLSIFTYGLRFPFPDFIMEVL